MQRPTVCTSAFKVVPSQHQCCRGWLSVAVLVSGHFDKMLENFACGEILGSLPCVLCAAVGSGLRALRQGVNHCHIDQTYALEPRTMWMGLCVCGGQERVRQAGAAWPHGQGKAVWSGDNNQLLCGGRKCGGTSTGKCRVV